MQFDGLRLVFDTRLHVYFAVVFCFTFFGSIPIVILKWPFLFAFVPLSIVFALLVGRNLLYPSFKFAIQYRKSVTHPAPDQFRDLASRMGRKLTEIKIITSEKKNAFATSGGIAFTSQLLKELDKNEIMAVTAHELAHKKGHHIFYKALLMIALLFVNILVWSRFTVPILFSRALTQSILLPLMMDTALIAFVIIELIPVSWYMEMKADEAAARFVGKSYIQSALLKLSKPEEAKINSESHPSVEERIKHIEKLKL